MSNFPQIINITSQSSSLLYPMIHWSEARILRLRQRLGVVLLRDNMGLLSSRAPEAAPAQVTGQL